MLEIILRHSKLVTEAIQQTMELKNFSPEDEALAETVKEVVSGGGWVMDCGASNAVDLYREMPWSHLHSLQYTVVTAVYHSYCSIP